MNDQEKNPRPPIDGEDSFLASKASMENGGAGETPTNLAGQPIETRKDIVAFDRMDVRVLGFCLEHYMANPDKPEDGPPDEVLFAAREKLKLLLNAWK